jgi:hypothetical protein
MQEAELIERLKEARKLIGKVKERSVEECMPFYKNILEAAYNGKLKIDPLEFPGGMISDLQNAKMLMNSIYGIPTRDGKEFVETNLLRIR